MNRIMAVVGLALLGLARLEAQAQPSGVAAGDAARAAPVEIQPPTAAGIAFFEAKIRPVLVASCQTCHSAQAPRLRGGLHLDSRDGILRGGASGPAILPGDPESSLLISALRYQEPDLRMPPKGKLPADVIADFEAWVRMGAPDPRTGAAPPAPEGEAARPVRRVIDIEKGREFWAFRQPVKREPPPVQHPAFAGTEIDRFLARAMEERGLEPVPEASRAVWIRRVSFDLTGLPPTPEEVRAFLEDRSPDAHATVVDRLLASPAFGERWGRHWLDVARYAESTGKENNVLHPHAWRYRDYVIDIFQADKPYDRFLREQIAGDLLPAGHDDERAANLIATGFLVMGTKSLATRDPRQFRMDLVDEQIDSTTQALLGLTVACARCHDHKYDPIPTEDYYALAGIFLSTEPCYGTHPAQQSAHPSPLLALPWGARVPDGPAMAPGQRPAIENVLRRLQATLDGAGRRGAAMTAGAGATPEERRQQAQRERVTRQQIAILEDLLDRFDEQGNPRPENRLAMGVREGRPANARVLERGEPDRPGPFVGRGFPQVLSGDGTPRILRGSGRRELAEWIASPMNPLTARVWVNRVWQHLFGRGLVATPDNFGMNGEQPSHPELLDWLAVDFMEDGWSTKRLIRRIVLTRAYRASSAHHAANVLEDPEAIYLWRMPKRRLEGEAIRDAMLAAAGILETRRPEGSRIGTLEGTLRREGLLAFATETRPVRSVYLPILRDRVPEALDVFDFAEPSFVTGRRESTNVATQALYLMNDQEAMAAAEALAARIQREARSEEQRIRRAFELVLGRPPEPQETAHARRFLAEFPRLRPEASEPAARRGRTPPARRSPEPEPPLDPWTALAQALFQTAEFRYVD